MFRNIFYNSRNSQIHLWEQFSGKDEYTCIDWTPYVFVPSVDGEIRSIEGQSVQKKIFKSYTEYYEYLKKNSDDENVFENNVKPEIQFLAERYSGIADDKMEVPKLTVYFLDIENYSETGFSKPSEANAPIVSISVHNALKNRTTVFGLKEYNGKWKGQEFLNYIHARDEKTLLRMFFIFMNRYPCDVISGWNVLGYDILYLINRTKKFFGDDTNIYKAMSPINTVRIWEEEKGPAKLDIAGVTVLDYMDLYKRYSPKKLERYSLDFVSKHELEKGKVDYSEYKDLNEFYNKNHDLFIEYNVMDTIRPKQLEEKLGYIKLVQSLSLLCKVPMKFYVAQTQLIEGLFIAYFRRNGLCAPHFSGGKQETFEAAYVKEPQSGMYDWICDFDITSSYPTHIIALNMSKETYFGRITGIPEDKIIFYVVSRNFPSFTITKLNGEQDIFEGQKLSTFNALLERRALAVAPNGSVFRTKPEGVLAKLERSIFDIRKDTKKRMIKVKQSLPELRDVNLNNAKERIEQLNSIQNSLKIVMNAQFGITAVPYSRYFNVNLSEAIASCGRITVRYGEKFINEFFQQGIYAKNKEMKDVLGQMGITEYPEIKNDMVAYGDTDSLYVKMGYFMDVVGGKIWQELDEKKKIHYLIRVSRIVYEYINDREYKEIQRGFYNSAVTDFKITFKQEMVAKTALFVKKKKYSMWIVDEEGATVDEIKTKGLEIIRSETPEAIRPKLKEIMEMILKRKSDNEITEKINTYKAELMNCIPEEISMNIGIRGMSDYIKGNVVLKGAPWHVKGVHAYRYLLKHLKLTDKYEELVDGNKTKVVYLKPNVFGFEEVSFLRWPKEFDRIIQIDYNKQIENNFTEKIKMLLAPMNKTNLLNDSGYRLSLFFK